MSDEHRHFVQRAIDEDLADGRYTSVTTRFPPEPNGYLHIGHAKAIALDFGLAAEFDGVCRLRFDDTNPTKESTEFVRAIERDVRWLGYEWEGEARYASDYFETLHGWAVALIEAGQAYVCSLSPDEHREHRGSLTSPGTDSPHRGRPVEESLQLFADMCEGRCAEGEHVLRAKIDMAADNINLRDPVMYRVLNAAHHRTGDRWKAYPTYDWAHGQSDAVEQVSHSLCTLEFDNHRPLYDWYIERLVELGKIEQRPRQIEFNPLNLTYTVMSKRRLRQLVEEGHVDGWDDPRMPTLCGLRRRGFTASAIRSLCARVGATRVAGVNDLLWLEDALRAELNASAERRMGVLAPLKVVLTDWGREPDVLEAINNPEDESAGTREVSFSGELYIERDDFMVDPPRKFYRLAPGREVRLRYAYLITCQEVLHDDAGNVVELRCTHDPASRGGNAPDGRKVKATLHWVDAATAFEADVRLIDRLFTVPDPLKVPEGGSFLDHLNAESLTVVRAMLERSLSSAAVGEHYQFERKGYFCVDESSAADQPVFNRIVTLRDRWAKLAKQQQAQKGGKGGRKRKRG